MTDQGARPVRMIGLRDRVGRRGGYLLIKSVVYLIHGWVYLTIPATPPLRAALRMPLEVAPLAVWGAVWLAAGLAAAAAAFARDPGHDRWGFLALIAVGSFWAVSYLWASIGGWSVTAFARGLLGAAFYAAIAGVVIVVAGWPEPPGRPR